MAARNGALSMAVNSMTGTMIRTLIENSFHFPGTLVAS
jgi:hypothetical protein